MKNYQVLDPDWDKKKRSVSSDGIPERISFKS